MNYFPINPINSFQHPMPQQAMPGPHPMRVLDLHNALPPFMQGAAWELHTRTGVSLEAVIPLMLGVAAAASQGVADVGFPNDLKSPLSLFVVLNSAPASGKSVVLEKLLNVFRRFEEERTTELLSAPDADPEARIQMLFSNMSKEALPQTPGLIVEEEGGGYVESRVGRDYPAQSKLWDGRLSRVNRISRAAQVGDHVRMGLVLTLPPRPWQRFIQRHGDQLLDSGLASRMLVCEVVAMQESQYTQERMRMGPAKVIPELEDRFLALLRQSAWTSLGVRTLPTLHMNEGAKRAWMQVGRHCEWMAQHGVPPQMQAHALRLPQMVGRVAAVIHLVEGYQGLLTAETIERARVICTYFLNEAMRMLLPPPTVPQIQLDAQALIGYLYRQPGARMDKSQLMFFAALEMSRPRAVKALQLLVASGRVVSSGTGRSCVVHAVVTA